MQLRSGFAMHPNRLMFAIGLAVLALSVPGTSFAGGTADPAGAELRALDGLQFRAGIVRADKGVTYGIVARVMGRISAGGFRKISLVTELEEG